MKVKWQDDKTQSNIIPRLPFLVLTVKQDLNLLWNWHRSLEDVDDKRNPDILFSICRFNIIL